LLTEVSVLSNKNVCKTGVEQILKYKDLLSETQTCGISKRRWYQYGRCDWKHHKIIPEVWWSHCQPTLKSVSTADDHLEKDTGTELNLASMSFLIMLLHDETYGKGVTPA